MRRTEVRGLSHLSPLTSHLSPLTSHLLRLTSHLVALTFLQAELASVRTQREQLEVELAASGATKGELESRHSELSQLLRCAASNHQDHRHQLMGYRARQRNP